jgi:hypothetical protein
MNIGIITRIEWAKINWAKETKKVVKLQQKIYRYSIDSKKTSVIATQKVLVQSLSAKLLAVRRVTQDNRGKSTAGVDGIKSLNSSERTRLARTLELYWSNRLAKFNGLNKRESLLLQHQQGLCNWCGLRLKGYDMIEVDHIKPKAKGGTDSWTNLQLLHSYCHDAKHA